MGNVGLSGKCWVKWEMLGSLVVPPLLGLSLSTDTSRVADVCAHLKCDFVAGICVHSKSCTKQCKSLHDLNVETPSSRERFINKQRTQSGLRNSRCAYRC